MKILGLIPALPENMDTIGPTLASLKAQTIPIDTIRIVDEKGIGGSLAERVSDAFNQAFSTINLQHYDYILRVDSDTTLPPNFLEENLKQDADVIGYGHAHIISVPVFLKVMQGRLHKDSDDSYLNYKFIHEGYVWKYWTVPPRLHRRAGKTHKPTYFLHRGVVMWLCGYEPFHVLGQFRWEWRNILAVFGYFACLIKRIPRLDVSKTVFTLQVKTLKDGITRRHRY